MSCLFIPFLVYIIFRMLDLKCYDIDDGMMAKYGVFLGVWISVWFANFNRFRLEFSIMFF